MTPTVRTAALLASAGLAALVVPAWAAVASALAVVGAAVVDAWVVRDAPPVERVAAGVLSRGVAAPLTVSARPLDGRRVLLRQPATPALTVRTTAGARYLQGEIVALRRGRHTLPGVASASVGPLGLARRHHDDAAPAEILVYPDMHTARRLVARLRTGRSAQDGRLRRGPLGLGTDFEAVREYSPDDDIRQLNWRASARLGRPMSNQYRIEQDREVVCLIDTGRLMAAPAPSGTLLDAALDAATAVALAADELGDRCGVIAFDAAVRRSLPPRRLGGRRVVHALFDLEPAFVDSDFERAFLSVGRARRALVIVFTDLVDEAAARSLVQATPMLVRHHGVIVVSARDPDLDATTSTAPTDLAGVGELIAALSVTEARTEAVTRLRRAGAQVVEAPAAELPARCLQAYLRAKARARL